MRQDLPQENWGNDFITDSYAWAKLMAVTPRRFSNPSKDLHPNAASNDRLHARNNRSKVHHPPGHVDSSYSS